MDVRAEEEPLPAKRSKLDLEPGEENNSGVVDIIDMDNSSEVVTKIAGIYAERLMSDVMWRTLPPPCVSDK